MNFTNCKYIEPEIFAKLPREFYKDFSYWSGIKLYIYFQRTRQIYIAFVKKYIFYF